MAEIDPAAARAFAEDVVRKLDAAGYQALWAGGCVRDQLRQAVPKDYDVATNARPEQVRQVFGRRRSIPVGAAFGVITVVGPPTAGTVEVATFRRDADYSDGRHPDAVHFSDEREDALRRDFTINGLFYDPLKKEVLDYVGGQLDLQAGIIRAIGDPRQRIAEDKLRMLRAIRFAVTFDFQIEPGTWNAICSQPGDIALVSAERIAEEMRRVLVAPQRRRAAELLEQSGILPVLIPELQVDPDQASGRSAWESTLAGLEALESRNFAAALALLLRAIPEMRRSPTASIKICRRWRLPNQDCRAVAACLVEEAVLRDAERRPWSQVQRILIRPEAETLVDYVTAVAKICDPDLSAARFCRERMAWPPERLNPTPLVTGNDLQQAGLVAGPSFRSILDTLRDRQLDHQITTQEEALRLARELYRHKNTTAPHENNPNENNPNENNPNENNPNENNPDER